MYNKFTLVLICVLIFLGQNVFADEAFSGKRTITVVGTGRASSPPDIVSLSLGVHSVDANLESAINDNNSRINKIIEVIKKYGIDEKNYNTSNFSVHYQQPYDKIEGAYNVNNNIYIEIDNIKKIGGFIQETLTAGANQFFGLEYSVKNTTPLMKKARKLAIKNAKNLALETADIAGVALGNILSIKESPYRGVRAYSLKDSFTLAEASGANSVTTVPGEKIVETEITMVFEIK